MFPADIEASARAVLAAARRRGLQIVTAESCTGGLVAGALTQIEGSSDVVDRGFVTYSNASKIDVLGVDAALIEAHGAVSAPVASAMALGALRASGAQLAVSITGIAGPGGGSPDKPVGLVHFAVASPSGVVHAECRFGDVGRTDVRMKSVGQALEMLRSAAD